jgi:tRNA A37 methylthiotransferase MiaB
MKSLEELKKLRDESINNMEMRNTGKEVRVVIGMATCGIAAGARPVLNSFVEEIAKRNLKNIEVVQTGCIGMCM